MSDAGPLGVVSGSGLCLEPILDCIDETAAFGDGGGLLRGGVGGHECVFRLGRAGARRVILQCGRLHVYEGYEAAGVARTVDWLYARGVRRLLFTNAAGGLLPGMAPGDLLAVDRVRLCRYARWAATPGILHTDFLVPECDQTGAYQWVPGPAYETRAEIAALQTLGAAAVGMSTAPELARCQELGIQAGVIACITNACCKGEKLSHDEVLAVAGKASDRMCRVIAKWLSEDK